jgi:hypothetical protein
MKLCGSLKLNTIYKGVNMAHFYGTVQGNRGEATRCGSKRGLETWAAGWGGAIRVQVYHQDGQDYVRVTKQPWHGMGKFEVIYEGLLGE